MTAENNNVEHVDDEVEKLLNTIAKDEKFKSYEINRAKGSVKGDGYLGIITAVEIQETSGTEKKILNLIVKAASKSDALRAQTPVADVFQREIYMYDTVLPTFQKFLIEKGLPVFGSFAKCLKATTLNKCEALILENLKSKGFRLWERKIPMDEDHVALVMRQYGRFHALSFALRDQYSDKFEAVANCMSDIFTSFITKTNFDTMIVNQCKKVIEVLDPIKDAEVLRVYKAFTENGKDFINDLPNLVDQYSVILHGDCWTNNMMFAYENSEKQNCPTKMCFIDLQIARLGPPVLDVSYFFYACSSKAIVSNFEKYLDIYYDSLSEYMKQLGSDPERVYPRSVFRRQWKESARFGLLLAIIVIKIMLSEQDEVGDFAEAAETGSVSEAFEYNIANNEEYNDRVKHVIMHFVNNNYI